MEGGQTGPAWKWGAPVKGTGKGLDYEMKGEEGFGVLEAQSVKRMFSCFLAWVLVSGGVPRSDHCGQGTLV